MTMTSVMSCAALLLVCLAQAEAFSLSGHLPSSSVRNLRGSVCVQMKAEDPDMDRMMENVANRMEQVKGRADFSGKDAENALSEAKEAAGLKSGEAEPKFMGSRRLAKLKKTVEEKNEELAFLSVINSLKNIKGREGFTGPDAEKALKELQSVERAVEDEEARLLGSRRMYKLVRKATETITRPQKRRNHPGEFYQESRH